MTDFKIQLIKIQETQDWPSLSKLLDQQFKINPDDIHSLSISSDIISTLGNILNTVASLKDGNYNDVIKDLYKALRNSVAYNSTIQMLVYENPTILDDTHCILQLLRETKEQNGVECMRMLMQFLINLIVKNTLVNKKIWEIFKDDIKGLIESDICLYHASALAYNIFHNDIELLREDNEIIKNILASYKQNNTNEYSTFLLELFIKDVHLNKTYINYNAEHRMLCLELMKDIFTNDPSLMTEELIHILSQQFKQKSDCILKTVTEYLNQIEPFEIAILLEVLASISSNENFVKYMQNDKSLLINCVFLLKSVHSVGKQCENNFSVIPKLSLLNDLETDILQHPSYGFKASLIRLLANLCWKHRGNQDEIQELDCIPLLLDCCNIDARNPFIIQWVIFAIRNLCENNIKNQDIIAAMNKQGVVSSAMLLEMGITIHSDEKQSMKIVPLNFNK